jgi:hypothetical protein
MDYTYLDYFNYYLKEFLNELVSNYPDTQANILSNYRNLLEGRDDKNDIYAKCYYTKINNYLGQIAKKDDSLFQTGNLIFIEGVDISQVWNSSLSNDVNRKAIWKYLQILMIIGRKIIPNHKEILDILNKISNGEIVAPAKVEKTLASASVDDDEKPSSVFNLGDIASSLGGLGGLANGLGGLLGGLGGGGGDGANGGGLGGIMSGITEMLNNPDFTNAMSQLSQQMSAGANQQDNTEETGENNDENTRSIEDNDANTGTNCSPSDERGARGEAGEGAQQQVPHLFNNPLFSDLAKEITSTFNFDDMEKDGKPANIGEALGKFMSGNNPAKLLSLVGKFGSKLQNEVKNGTINPAELLSQTMGSMGGMPAGMQQTMENMMNNPQVRSQMNRVSQQQATRDRLKAKLDAKRKETRDEQGKQ